MKSIFKYPLPQGPGAHPITMPQGAEVLALQHQAGTPTIWALVDDKEKDQEYTIDVVGTGWPLHDDFGLHLGTLQQGPFVWHYFLRPQDLTKYSTT